MKVHALLVLAILGSLLAACAANPKMSPKVDGDGRPVIDPPLGWRERCRIDPKECRFAATQEPPPVIRFISPFRDIAEMVNAAVNKAVRYEDDAVHYGTGRTDWWMYPTDGRGDCEDYALEKQRQLLLQGWPQGNLLLAFAVDDRGEYHGVLILVTDEGEMVLDSNWNSVSKLSQSPYRILSRQSRFNPSIWVSVEEPKPPRKRKTIDQ